MRTVRGGVATAAACVALVGLGTSAAAQPTRQKPPAFEFEAAKTGGPRNVALVYVDYSDAKFKPSHPPSFYSSFFSGQGLNVHDFFLEASGGSFTFNPIAGIGPITYPDDPATKDDESKVGCYATSAACPTSSRTDDMEGQTLIGLLAKRFNLSAYDTNRDGRVDPSELTIVFITAGTNSGKNRRAGPGKCAKAGAVSVCGDVAYFGEDANVATFEHELFHFFTDADLYTPFNGPIRTNIQATTMGATAGYPERWSVTLDPWNRIRSGWVRPRAFSRQGNGGCVTLDSSLRGGKVAGADRAPIAFYDEANGDREFFLVEYRKRKGYDANVAGSGVFVWYVKSSGADDKHWADFDVVPKRGNRLASRPASGSDDTLVDLDGDGIPDAITWGPNHRLETRAAPGDELGGTNFVLAASLLSRTNAIGVERYTGQFGMPQAITRSDGPVKLVRPDGTDAGATLYIGDDAGDDRLKVRLVTASTPQKSATADEQSCWDATAFDQPMLMVDAPACVPMSGPDARQIDYPITVRISPGIPSAQLVDVRCTATGFASSPYVRFTPNQQASTARITAYSPSTTAYNRVMCTATVNYPRSARLGPISQSVSFATFITPAANAVQGAVVCGGGGLMPSTALAPLLRAPVVPPITILPFDPRAVPQR